MTAKYTTILSEQLLRGRVGGGLSAWLFALPPGCRLVTQHQPESMNGELGGSLSRERRRKWPRQREHSEAGARCVA